MFRKISGDPKSSLWEHCSDCRNQSAIWTNERRDKTRTSIQEDEFFCGWCKKPRSINIRAKNLDGTQSNCCIDCKQKSFEYSRKSQEFRLAMKEENIKKQFCSCEICKNIYLTPEEGSHHVVELSTYEKDGVRYVDYKGETYEAEKFVHKFENLLETRVLQFDHLNEEEQRERGILKEDDIYVGKRGNVSQMGSISSIVRETEKTRIICIRCHVKETKRREKGDSRKSGLIKQKMDYMNKIREKGCSVCGFYDPELLRFLDFDHIDPENKTCNVSKMVVDSEYDIDAFIRECDDSVTRILCKHCHSIHTSEQQDWFYTLH